VQIDVFTLVPHAFAWLTEQRPVAAVLGEGLELRLFNYRDSTPLRAGQVDDEPYGGGAGMVLRVDVVAAALEAVYGDVGTPRTIAFTPQGRQLDQRLVEELAREGRLTLLSSRFEGFDERVLARLLPGALGSESSAREETFSPALEGGLEYPHYTRPADFRGWRVPDVLLSGDHGRIASWRREESRRRTGTRDA
jgi:tRNA (guanine37-N1)-methyltransferase